MANGQTLTRYDITDLNNGLIPEYGVDDPPGWDAISLYYAKALQEMGWNPSGTGDAPDAPSPQDPNIDPAEGTPNPENTWTYSEEPGYYFFWGAMHWWPGHDWEFFNDNAPAPQNEYWSHCTHGPAQVEKYFLPWHRAYIYFYEMIIREKVAALDGPDTWALPYWNYSHFEPNDPAGPWPRSTLPWIFCQPELPDGSANPLFLDTTRRGLQPTLPDGTPMRLQVGTPFYSGAYGQHSWEPAGNPNLGFNQTLDGRPHGHVHNDTGSGDNLISATGWMQYTQLAGFDPIFWLHHSEIDRFWVGWNAAGGQDPDQQTDPDWLTAADDDIEKRWNFWTSGDINDVVVVHPGDMLDPANLTGPQFPYSYQYQNSPEVPAPRPPGRALVADAVPALAVAAAPAEAAPAASSEEIASHEEPVEVVHDPVTTPITLASEAPSLLSAADSAGPDETPPRTVLQLDGIVTKGPNPGNYEVYINNPEADSETLGAVPHFAGSFSGFGSNHSHGGGHVHGVSASYDITDLVAYLRANDQWDESKVNVTIVPAVRPVAGLTPVLSPVTIGSVRIVTG